MRALNIHSLEHRELQSSRTGEKYSLSLDISELVGCKDFFVHHEIIPPGRSASAPHSHSHREEMVVVLEGTPTAHLSGKTFPLKTGDFMRFPPGSENVHFVRNESDAPARILVIASNPETDQVMYS